MKLLLVALIVTSGLAVIGTPAADAHAVLQATDPTSGAVLVAAPKVVTLTFNEPVSLPTNAVRVLDSRGTDVAAGAAKAVGPRVTVGLRSKLARGSYIVAWKAISADSHPVSGAFTFAVGAPTAPGAESTALAKAEQANETSDTARALVDVTTALAYLGSLMAIGAAAFLVWLAPRDPTERTRSIRRLVVTSAVVGAAGLVLGVIAEAVLIAGGSAAFPSWGAIGDQVSGSTGLQAVIGCAGLLVIVFGAVPTRRPPIARRVCSVAGATLVAAGFVLVGHTRTATPIGATIAADLTHVIAAAVWTGGLVALLIYLRNADQPERDDGQADDLAVLDDAAVVARFSGWAGVAIVAVMLAGSVLAWQILGSWGALVHTNWGVLLLVKVGLFAIVAGIGAYNRFALVGRVRSEDRGDATIVRRRLSSTLKMEAAVFLAIIAVTSVLTSSSPEPESSIAGAVGPTTTLFDPSAPTAQTCEEMRALPGMENMQCDDHPPTSETVTAAFGQGRATITVDPSRVGPNHVVVTLEDSAGAPIEPHSLPVFDFRVAGKDIGPFTQTGQRVGAGQFAVTQDLVLAGKWEITVSAAVTEFDELQASVAIQIDA